MSIELVAGQTRRVDVSLTSALATFSGRVRDTTSWNLLAGVKVSLDSLTVYSDSSGNFSFLKLTPGNYTIIFEKEGYQALTQTIGLVTGYNEIFFKLTPVAVEEGYFVVSPEWKEINYSGVEYGAIFTITNTGGASKTEEVAWSTPTESGYWTLTLSPGQSVSKSLSLIHPGYPEDATARVRSEEMGGAFIVHFYGGFGGELAPTDLDVLATASLDEKYNAWLPLSNIGTGYFSYTVKFYINDTEVGSSRGGLYPDESRTPGYPLHMKITKPGTYTISAILDWDGHQQEYSKTIIVY